jgi:hypothetical protein
VLLLLLRLLPLSVHGSGALLLLLLPLGQQLLELLDALLLQAQAGWVFAAVARQAKAGLAGGRAVWLVAPAAAAATSPALAVLGCAAAGVGLWISPTCRLLLC